MRRVLASCLLILGLASCSTAMEEPPIAITPGNGAVAMDLSVTAVGLDNHFYMKISAVDSATGKIAVKQPEQLSPIGIRYRGKALKTDYQLMVRELPPGDYVIEGLAIDPNKGNKPLLIALFSELAIAVENEGVYKAPRFVDDSGVIEAGAPRFKIKPGVVTYIGELIFAANTIRMEVPRKDNSGFWDGQETELVWDAEIIAVYATDGPGVSRHGKRLSLQTYKAETTLFSNLVGKQIVLKNFELTENHQYATNEYKFKISVVR